jgi:hypothetical protein
VLSVEKGRGFRNLLIIKTQPCLHGKAAARAPF